MTSFKDGVGLKLSPSLSRLLRLHVLRNQDCHTSFTHNALRETEKQPLKSFDFWFKNGLCGPTVLLQNGPIKNLSAAGKQLFLSSIYITHANTSITLSFQRGAVNVLINVCGWGLSVGLHQLPSLHPRWVRGQHSWPSLAATAFRSSVGLANPSHNSRGHPQAAHAKLQITTSLSNLSTDLQWPGISHPEPVWLLQMLHE